MSASGPAQPGDTIYLAAGTYTGRFVSTVVGAPAAPIVVRALPGAHVILDANVTSTEPAIAVQGGWTRFIGLEVTNSNPNRDVDLGSGFHLEASHVKVVNCVIHDLDQGVYSPASEQDVEIYGSLLYNNGWMDSSGHGAGLLLKNTTGIKRIEDNIIFFGFYFGIMAYDESQPLKGLEFIGNTWFAAGAAVPGSGGLKDNCLVGGNTPTGGVLLRENMGWASSTSARGVQLGYSGGVANGDATVLDNYLMGELRFTSTWEAITMSGNTVYGGLVGQDAAAFPQNTFSSTLPAGHKVFLRPNVYDTGRANLIIYNWSWSNTVPVDLSSVVDIGATYAIRSVYDPFGTPVVQGVYDGVAVDVPMDTVPAPQPIGDPSAVLATEQPRKGFGAFIVAHTPCQ